MFLKAERFPGAKTPESSERERRHKEAQSVTRATRLDRRNRIKELKSRWEHYYRRRSWIKPFLRKCRTVQDLPIEYRREAYKNYLPFERLPRELIYGDLIRVSNPLDIWNETPKTEEEESISSEESITRTSEEPNRRNLGDGVGSAIILNSTVKALFGTNSSVILRTTMQPGGAVGLPNVPIAIAMGNQQDRTTNVSPLPIFNGRMGSDPDYHMAQFLTAAVANNGRTEELWL